MADKKTMAERLRIPVNPSFDETRDPGLQTEYVNPVALNNKTIQLANAYIALTEQWVKARQKEYLAQKDLRLAEVEREDFEAQLMIDRAPSANDIKSLKTTQAYLYRVANETGKREAYANILSKLDEAKEHQAFAELCKEQAHAWLHAVEQQATNIQTHLSFVKNEMRAAKSYT